MGGMGSFYGGFREIQDNGLKVVLNDLNPMIFNLNKSVQGKSTYKKILLNISNIVRMMFRKYNTYELTHKQYKEFHIKLLKLLNHIEKKGKNSILGSSILLFLMNNGFGGNYKVSKKGSYISPSTDDTKYVRFFNFVGKVEFYHYLYTSVNVKFENKDYKYIIKKYSSKTNTYTTFDPPYLGRNEMSIEEFEIKMKELEELVKNSKTKTQRNKYLRQQNKLLEGCVYNYGLFGDTFNHEQLLKDLPLVKGVLNYFNYPHPIIYKYSEKYNLDINLLGRKSTNGHTKSGEKIKTKFEVFMTGKINQNPLGNNPTYVPSDIQKVS